MSEHKRGPRLGQQVSNRELASTQEALDWILPKLGMVMQDSSPSPGERVTEGTECKAFLS